MGGGYEGKQMNLQRLLKPRSIAVLGGTQAEEVVRQCQRMAYTGEIWPVHPRKTVVCGYPVYKSLDELPAPPDATFVGVNRELTIEIIRQLAAMKAGGAVCYASGFLEADAKGGDLQTALLEATGDMPSLGPNCYGLINYVDGALLWPDQHGGRRLAAGEKGVAMIVQSSNLAINLTMQQRGLPVAYMLTAGNQAQVGLSELAMAVLDDPQVTALGMHIEGFDSIVGMEALANHARKLNKPIVALKVGRSEQAQQAAMTHTASLAGTHAASSAFLQRLGIGQVSTVAALLETLKLLHVYGVLPGYRLCSMSCSGGEASLMADAAQGRKVFFPGLSAEQKAPVEAVLGERVTVDNPLDYHTYIWSDEAGMSLAYQRMLENGFDLGLLVLDFPHPEHCDDALWQVALRAFELAVNNSDVKAAVVTSLPENLPEKYVQQLMAQGIAALGGFEDALVAAEVAADIGLAWQQPTCEAVMSTLVDGATSGRITLTEVVSKSWLRDYAVPIPFGLSISSLSELDTVLAGGENTAMDSMSFPLVAKKMGVAHKTEANAVRLNLGDAAEVHAAVSELLEAGGEVLLESMVTGCVVELIIGLVRDAQFGLVMTLGAGGIFVEVLKDTATLLLPATRDDIEQALKGLRIAPLFEGYRGKPQADLQAAVEAVLRVQAFALDNADTLVELDINPLMVRELGKGASAADALIVKQHAIACVQGV